MKNFKALFALAFIFTIFSTTVLATEPIKKIEPIPIPNIEVQEDDFLIVIIVPNEWKMEDLSKDDVCKWSQSEDRFGQFSPNEKEMGFTHGEQNGRQ